MKMAKMKTVTGAKWRRTTYTATTAGRRPSVGRKTAAGKVVSVYNTGDGFTLTAKAPVSASPPDLLEVG